jgi:hypothetical protein
MAQPEKQAWLFLIASVVLWSFLAMRMLDGATIAPVTPRHMLWTYAAIVLGMIVSHSVIAAVLAVAPGVARLRDERDAAIEARADRIEGYVVVTAVNVLVIHSLAGAIYPDNALLRVDLSSVPTLLFALLSTLFLGHVSHQLATIWMYRR